MTSHLRFLCEARKRSLITAGWQLSGLLFFVLLWWKGDDKLEFVEMCDR